MSLNSLEKFTQFVDCHDHFYVMGHEGPDLDCLCSQLVLGRTLDTRLGKGVTLLSSGPFNRDDLQDFERYFKRDIPINRPHFARLAVILLDCASFSRTGFDQIDCDLFIIDHHATTETIIDDSYIQPHAPSVTLMILRAIKALGINEISLEDAELLMLGYCADTGFFRHLVPSAAEFMQDVAELLHYGVELPRISERMEGRFTLVSRQYMGKLLSHCQSFVQGKLLMVVESHQDVILDRDSPTLYRMLLSVEEVELVVLVRPKNEGHSVGLRSRGKIDVGQVAQCFGGGGHKKAAGFFSTFSVGKLQDHLVNYFEKFYINHE